MKVPHPWGNRRRKAAHPARHLAAVEPWRAAARPATCRRRPRAGRRSPSPSSSTTADRTPVANDHARDTRAQADLAAALRSRATSALVQALGAAFRETVAARGRGDREHVREARAEPVVRADVDVQAQAGEHAPRGFGLEQARREAAPCCAGTCRRSSAAGRRRGAASGPTLGNGPSSAASRSGSMPRVKPGQRAKRVRVARAAERRGLRSPRRARCRRRCRRRPGDSSRSGRVASRRRRPADPAPGTPGWSRRTERSRRRRRGRSRAASAPRCRARRPRAAGSPRAPAP